jgi:IS30 family transposase
LISPSDGNTFRFEQTGGFMNYYHHLTYDQRCQIYALNKRGFSLREISADICVHFSTISRELRRNKGRCGYRHNQAQALAKQRKSVNNPCKILGDTLALVEQKLALQWSPQQISGWLQRHGLAEVSHEAIYQHVCRDKHLGGKLYLHLRHAGKKYNKRAAKSAGRGFIPDRVDISERPDIVEEKSRIGDWELDTIIGAKHQGAIVSVVDRASKFALLKPLPNKKSDGVSRSIISMLQRVNATVHTLTADNGKEFSGHKKVAKELAADFYFAEPYCSWQRGLNEHTNGLVRQYFPKKTDLSKITAEQVQKVENLINNRPRAVLGFRTPTEVFFAENKEPPAVALQH